jgi:sarcosine oxidase, subunit gamma
MSSLSLTRHAPVVSASLFLRALPPAERYVLRGAAAATAAAADALGFAIPAIACRAIASGDRAALWLGPDEWLLLGPAPPAPGLAAALRAALAGLPHSLVDVSHRQSALAVSGAHATALLACGCPLDLDEQAFPVGMCTRTMLSKAEIVLWRTGAQEFRIEVWRSFIGYVTRFLDEAARGVF